MPSSSSGSPPGPAASSSRRVSRSSSSCVPVEGETRYFVYTRWESEEAFQNWVNSQAFQHGHAKAESSDGKPVSSGASLLGFEVIQHVTKSVRLTRQRPAASDGEVDSVRRSWV